MINHFESLSCICSLGSLLFYIAHRTAPVKKRMEIYSDAMDINRVAKITGYSRTTILRRVQNGDIFAVMMNDEYVISKAGVIEFFASDKAFRIYDKSKWQEKAIEYLWKRLK